MNARRTQSQQSEAEAALEAYRSYLLTIVRSEKTTINRMAEEIGRSASTLNRYITGSAKKLPEIETVQALWKRYKHLPPPPEIAITLEPAGGLAEPTIKPISGKLPASAPALARAQTVWRVRDAAATTLGYLPGDYFVLDQSGIEPRDGDHLVVNIKDEVLGAAETVIRVLKGTHLMPPNPASDEVFLKDHRKVEIMGVIVRSWRERP
jgi:SOS-response transcriptional repressor LexA